MDDMASRAKPNMLYNKKFLHQSDKKSARIEKLCLGEKCSLDPR